jgi:hypothetical protein
MANAAEFRVTARQTVDLRERLRTAGLRGMVQIRKSALLAAADLQAVVPGSGLVSQRRQ